MSAISAFASPCPALASGGLAPPPPPPPSAGRAFSFAAPAQPSSFDAYADSFCFTSRKIRPGDALALALTFAAAFPPESFELRNPLVTPVAAARRSRPPLGRAGDAAVGVPTLEPAFESELLIHACDRSPTLAGDAAPLRSAPLRSSPAPSGLCTPA